MFSLLLHRMTRLALMAVVIGCAVPRGFGAEPESPTVGTLAELRDAVLKGSRQRLALELEGTVCAIGRKPSGLLALQDATETVLLELPELPDGISAGARIRIRSGKCEVTRGSLVIQLGTGSIIDIDGHHSAVTRMTGIHLGEGLHPFRVEWFNGYSDSALALDFEGPGISRRPVPDENFSHASGAGERLPGLLYQSFPGAGWPRLPDFSRLKPSAEGTVRNLDLSVRPREEDCGIVFQGSLRIPVEGNYRFFMTSDDGGRLFIGRPDLVIEKAGDGKGTIESAGTPSRGSGFHRDGGEWITAEGSVTFASFRDGRLELDVTGETSSFHVVVADAEGMDPSGFLRHRVKASGVAFGGKIVVIDGSGLESSSGTTADGSEMLTRIVQVRRLQRVEASRSLRARIRGVVTMVTQTSLVLQDPSGGVFVHYPTSASPESPKPGEIWEIEGTTHPGDFSPVIMATRGTYAGTAPMPAAVRPTAEQIASGTLDAELIEIEGVVTSASATELVLMTREREIHIDGHRFYPLPLREYDGARVAELSGAVVRIRGVLAPEWDPTTRRVNPGRIKMGNAAFSVEEPAPQDPFAIERIQASDLFLFSSHPTAFRRVKVSGLVVHARPPEYFLSDGGKAFRFIARDAPDLAPGDQVEAVGFPKLGGQSPVLLEADVRKTGKFPVPAAVRVGAVGLPSPGMDSLLVTMDARLLGDTIQKNERVLELEAGAVRFVARLAGLDPASGAIERGSLLRVTGVYASAPGDQAASSTDPFELLMNGPADIVVLKRGPWWTPRHTMVLVAVLSGGLLLALAWVTVLRRLVNQRGKQLAIEIEGRQVLERHRAMEQERTRVAQDLHDELGSGLTEAGILSSLARNPQIPQDKKNTYLDQLSEVCRTLVTGLDEIVWAVNPRYDSVSDLAGYYSMYAQRFLGLAGITCRLEIDDTMPEHPLDAHVRHGIFLAFKEALNNIVRHAEAKEVRLAIGVDGGELKVSLADDGRGFESASHVPGKDGLAGMKQRMEKLGGDCRVTGSRGGGTTVVFVLPLERSAA